MGREIVITDNLYEKLASYAKGFDTPADVIQRLLSFYENNHSQQPLNDSAENLEIIFEPPNIDLFKKKLLESTLRTIYIKTWFKNGNIFIRSWDAKNITKESDIENNLRSGYLRKWQERGIYRVEVSLTNQLVPNGKDTDKAENIYEKIYDKDKSGIKIGRLAQLSFRFLLDNNLLSQELIKKLHDRDYCKGAFKMIFPLLVTEDVFNKKLYSRKRFYKDKYQNYYLCSQWAEHSRPYLIAWLRDNGFLDDILKYIKLI